MFGSLLIIVYTVYSIALSCFIFLFRDFRYFNRSFQIADMATKVKIYHIFVMSILLISLLSIYAGTSLYIVLCDNIFYARMSRKPCKYLEHSMLIFAQLHTYESAFNNITIVLSPSLCPL